MAATAARNAPPPVKQENSANARQKRIAAVRRVKAATEKKKSYLLNGFAVNIVNALFDEMEGMDQKEALKKHFNTMRVLKTHYATCMEEYSILINLSWVNLIKRKDERAVPEPSPDVAPLLKSYSKKTTMVNRNLLEELKLRFGNLAKMELKYHPLMPANFYLCFWHATEKLDLDPEERRLLIPIFDRYVMERINLVLSAANQCLIDQQTNRFSQFRQPE